MIYFPPNYTLLLLLSSKQFLLIAGGVPSNTNIGFTPIFIRATILERILLMVRVVFPKTALALVIQILASMARTLPLRNYKGTLLPQASSKSHK